MAIEALRDIVARLQTSSSALAALAAALDRRVSGAPLDPSIAPHVDAVVAALGAAGPLEAASSAELRPLLGEIRTFALTGSKLLFAASRAAGWAHTEPELLVAAGDVSAGIPSLLKTRIAPALDGLAERLDRPGAAFLDVGVGAAVMSVEMARLWPSMRVVGIDPWGPALAIARERVRAAGLDGRIELRQQAGEDLTDTDAFDLAWIPSVFVPERVVAAVVHRVHLALRPGGWLLFPMLRPHAEPLPGALARLRTAMFGGMVAAPETIEALLREQGMTGVRALPSPPTSVTAMVVGRRAP
jgi:2-polyprenyl-3-methyl-5-hydroxy-6-metoxy-1,4-benzoquinol methylase